MKKIIYTFLAVSVIVLAGCLKNEAGPTGSTGPAGSTGAPGGDLTPIQLYPLLNAHYMAFGSGSNYFGFNTLPGYNKNYTYSISVTVQRDCVPAAKEVYTLPISNVYAPGDEIYATIGHDSVKINYYNPAASGWPDTSLMNAVVNILPKDTLVK
jgi:hypothetical protein